MIKIKIITAGKLKEKYLVDGINEYTKRMKSFAKLEFYEVVDQSIPEHCSLAQEEIIRVKEGKNLLSKVKSDDYVILLDINGTQLSSIALANYIEELAVNGISSIVFMIGGSLGVSEEVKNRADYKLSFSKMTFPHQLMKLILMEQIYRCFKIINKQEYHK